MKKIYTKNIYTLVALLTLCFCVATGLTGCKKTPGEELNNLALSDIFELCQSDEKYYYSTEEINKMCSNEGCIVKGGKLYTTVFKAKQDVTIKSISLTADFLYDANETWISIRKKNQYEELLESEKISALKNTYYNYSMTSEEGITIKKGGQFIIHINYRTIENTGGIAVVNSVKNLKFTFI